jgi:hypothetical protein
MKQWSEKEYSQMVYYDDEDGRIIGSVYKVGNNQTIWETIWGAQVNSYTNESLILGQYINLEYAMKGVEYFWDVHSRTLVEDKS